MRSNKKVLLLYWVSRMVFIHRRAFVYRTNEYVADLSEFYLRNCPKDRVTQQGDRIYGRGLLTHPPIDPIKDNKWRLGTSQGLLYGVNILVFLSTRVCHAVLPLPAHVSYRCFRILMYDRKSCSGTNVWSLWCKHFHITGFRESFGWASLLWRICLGFFWKETCWKSIKWSEMVDVLTAKR